MQRKFQKALTLVTLLGGLSSLPAWADHNSVWGPGMASMPNDIHNARIEDDLDQDEWTDFVQYGSGADTVNRYEDTSTSMGGSSVDTSSMGSGRR